MQKYSFLMSVYKKENPKYLEKSIQSMLNQTIKPDEIIIVKDGPLTKQLDTVITRYEKQNKKLFKIIQLKKNIGLGLALNEGIKKSKNELIARMDSDDISKPERCEKQLKQFSKNKNLSICGTNIEEFYETTDNIIGRRIVPESSSDIYEFGKRRSPFNHPTVMYKKKAVIDNNGYSDLRRNQDVDLFGRMMYSGCYAYNVEESLLYFRANSQLTKRRKSCENTKSYIGTIKRFWKMGYSSFTDYIAVLIMQTIVFICPEKIQYFIYKRFLRK